MAGISTSYPLKGPSTEWSWITIDLWKDAHKLLHAFLRYRSLGKFGVEKFSSDATYGKIKHTKIFLPQRNRVVYNGL